MRKALGLSTATVCIVGIMLFANFVGAPTVLKLLIVFGGLVSGWYVGGLSKR